jgi:hypothetical protein
MSVQSVRPSQPGGTQPNSQLVTDRRAAFELLGLTTGDPFTHDRLRRAYLRRLRAHPPERDPDGFRRLREAFEQLEPWARMHDHMQAAAAEPEQPVAPAHGSDEPERSEAPPHPAEQAEASATAPGMAATEGSETAANIDRPDDPAGRGDPPRDDKPGAARASKASEAEASGAPTADLPPTLRGVIDEILALLQAGKLDAALDLADAWSHSAVDDHRQVSPHDAQRWALTRELLDVAPAQTDALRRAIAHGIATDNLATVCSEAEAFQALSLAQAADLARHLARRAPNLCNVLARPLRSRTRYRDAPARSSRSSRAVIWAAVAIVGALLRAFASCDQTSHKTGLEDMPAQGLQLDPEVVRRLERQSRPPIEELGSNQWRELPPEGLTPPSQP